MDSANRPTLIATIARHANIVLSNQEYGIVERTVKTIAPPALLLNFDTALIAGLNPLTIGQEEPRFWLDPNKDLRLGGVQLNLALIIAKIGKNRRREITIIYVLIARLIRLEKQNGYLFE